MTVWMGCENMVNSKRRRSDASFRIVKMSAVAGINIRTTLTEPKIFLTTTAFPGWYE